MNLFIVSRQAGPAWGAGGILEQPAVEDHASFMGQLAGEGFVLGAGPLAGSEGGQLRALVIVRGESEAEVRSRLARDPWERTGRLVTVDVEPWRILVGAERFIPRP